MNTTTNGSINSDTQNSIVSFLRNNGGYDAARIANKTGIPFNTVRGSLTKLAARGVVEKAGGGIWRVKTENTFLTNV